jgi:hypothetical protein
MDEFFCQGIDPHRLTPIARRGQPMFAQGTKSNSV